MMTLRQFAKQAATAGALKNVFHKAMVKGLEANRAIANPVDRRFANSQVMARVDKDARFVNAHYSGQGGTRISRAEFRAKRQANPYTATPGVPMAQKPLTPRVNS